MRPVILDIGAESTHFLLSLRRNNKGLPMLMFAGEPKWRGRSISKSRTSSLIADKNAVGIHRVVSRYKALEFPDESIDLITVNSPHGAFVLEYKMFEREALRCLKPNGYLLFDFRSDTFNFESSLVHEADGIFQSNKKPTDISAFVKLRNCIPNRISPARFTSETMAQMDDPIWGALMRKIHVPRFEVWHKSG